MSKLNKDEIAFVKTFISSLVRAFKKLQFSDKNLRKYCVSLVKRFRSEIKNLQQLTVIADDYINKAYAVNDLVRKNINNDKFIVNRNSQDEDLQEKLSECQISGRKFELAVAACYGKWTTLEHSC